MLSEPLHVEPGPLAGVRVLQVIDSDPLNYPPTINAARVLANAGAQVLCLGGMRMLRPMVPLPANVTLRYAMFGAPGQQGLKKLKWGAGRVLFRRAVLQAVEETRPQLVIAYDPGAGWAVLPLCRRSVGPKVVFHLHDNEDAKHHHWRSVRAWQWWSLVRRLDEFTALVVPDTTRGEELRRAWGTETPYQVVGNVPQREVPARNSVLRERLGLSEEAKLAIVVGNMGMLGFTARAISRAAPEWHLVIVGASDDVELAALAHEAQLCNVEHRVHVLPYTDYDTMRTWIRGCHVGLALYPNDSPIVNWRYVGTASVKAMEYTAAGIPTIVHSHSGFNSIAEKIRSMHVLREENDTAIVEALNYLSSTPVWFEQCTMAVDAHLSTYNTEVQLAPLLTLLGFDGAALAPASSTTGREHSEALPRQSTTEQSR